MAHWPAKSTVGQVLSGWWAPRHGGSVAARQRGIRPYTVGFPTSGSGSYRRWSLNKQQNFHD